MARSNKNIYENKNNMRSLGLDLFHDEDHKDFELLINDGKLRVSTSVHRRVITTCSTYLSNKIGGKYKFYYELVVPEGYIAVTLRLVKFFYTRDLDDLGDISQTIEMCLKLECSNLFKSIYDMSKNVKKKRPPSKRRRSTTTSTEDTYEPPITRRAALCRKMSNRRITRSHRVKC